MGTYRFWSALHHGTNLSLEPSVICIYAPDLRENIPRPASTPFTPSTQNYWDQQGSPKNENTEEAKELQNPLHPNPHRDSRPCRYKMGSKPRSALDYRDPSGKRTQDKTNLIMKRDIKNILEVAMENWLDETDGHPSKPKGWVHPEMAHQMANAAAEVFDAAFEAQRFAKLQDHLENSIRQEELERALRIAGKTGPVR